MYSIFPYIKNQATAVDTFKSEWPKPKNRSPEKLCLPEMVDIMGFSFARHCCAELLMVIFSDSRTRALIGVIIQTFIVVK